MRDKTTYERFCNMCGSSYTPTRTDSRFCSATCKQMNYKRKKQFEQMINEIKMDYPKMTFRLSVFGFVASAAFYLGVLRDLSEPKGFKDKKIEQLQEENERLEKHIDLLEKKY